MAIATLDGLVAALTSAQRLSTYKTTATTKGAGYFHSLFFQAGYPGAASAPATGVGEVPTSATAGAIPFVNAGGGNDLYLARASVSSGTIGHFTLYDRLWQVSGLSGTSTSGQNVNSTALTRRTSGVGVQLWVEWQTATGASASNLTVSYTNTADTAGRSSVIAFQQSPVAYQCQPVPLQSGDVGIKSVQTATLSGSTGTAGNWGFFMAYPLMDFPITVANAAVLLDAIACGLPTVDDDACLSYMLMASAATQTPVCSLLSFVEG